MKFSFVLSFVFFAFITTAPCQHPLIPVENAPTIFQNTGIEVFFSPNGGAEQAIIKEINAAKKSVFVLAYAFTSAPIAKALGQAKDRGVNVKVILDKSHKKARYSVINYLRSHHIPVFIDVPHAIAHNKIMIIDARNVITGSYNFTSAAEKRNTENLLIIRNNPQIARLYATQWYKLHTQSEPAHQSVTHFIRP